MADSGQTVVGNIGIDLITGGNGDDRISGMEGADILRGGDGADIITGGTGSDNLSGEDGSDIFVFASGDTSYEVTDETITDFETGFDKLDFGSGIDAFVIEDGSSMVLSTFKDAAEATFTVGDMDVYIAYNVSGLNDALVAVDHNKDGSFNLGDTLIKLSDISLDTEILVGDIQTYIG
ncbi:M10 family metallopeptidase C-terminal domain-containing protein, partial [Amylibacter sp.]|nr:M10 family metallopeptidase C-terminal domain-containing protein [Amylibacter sp.]